MYKVFWFGYFVLEDLIGGVTQCLASKATEHHKWNGTYNPIYPSSAEGMHAQPSAILTPPSLTPTDHTHGAPSPPLHPSPCSCVRVDSSWRIRHHQVGSRPRVSTGDRGGVGCKLVMGTGT